MGFNALPPGPRLTASGYLAAGVLPAQRGCSTRTQWGGFATPVPSRSAGTRKAVTYRTWDRLAARGAGVGSIQFHYANAYGGASPLYADNSGGEVADLQPITVTASLEINTNAALTAWLPTDAGATVIPLTFSGGQNAVTLVAGASTWTDDLFVRLAAAQAYYVNSHVVEPVNGIWPIRSQGVRGLAAASSEGSNAGDYALTPTAPGGSPTITGTIPAANRPVVPGSFAIGGSGITGLAIDNGSGAIAGTGVSSGSIDYAAGSFSVTLTTTPAAGTAYSINVVGGTAPVDETKTKTKTNYYSTGSNAKGNLAPDAARGRPLVFATPRMRSIAVVGDSVLVGAGSASGDVSWVDYCAAQGGFGVLKVPVVGEKAQTFAQALGSYRRLSALAGNFDRVIGNYATNDIALGRSIAQVQADLTAIWQMLALLCPNGASDIWWCTLLPRTSRPGNVAIAPTSGPYTAAGAAYGSGSVAGGTPSARNALNAWLHAQVGNSIGGVIDIAAAVELSPASRIGGGSGQWADVTTDSADGTHPAQVAHQTKIPGLVGPSGTAPSAAWTFPV